MPLAQRDVNTPQPHLLRTPPAQKIPQIPSRLPLPRRAVTPNSAPSRPQWSSRVADRVASHEHTMGEAMKPQQQGKRGSVTIRPHQSNTSTPTYAMLADKPLPSKPVVQFSYLQSPSRDSRALIDATEQPLQMSSPSGAKREWPTLTPTPAPATTSTPSDFEIFEKGDDSPKAVSPATAFSINAAAMELTKVITGTVDEESSPALRRSGSSASSYESATESSTIDREAVFTGPQRGPRESRNHSTPDGSQSISPLPRRNESLRNRFSSGSLIPQASGSTRKLMTFTDFTRDGAASPAIVDSRPHSPSPASFSRPRPGSGSFRTPSGSVKVIKTASRLPIPDSKKPIIVDVKPRTSQSSTKSTHQPPIFGNRRLDSRTADILDNGIKRRQLQRIRTNEEEKKPAIVRAPSDASNATTLDTPSASVGHQSGIWNSEDSDCQAAFKSEGEISCAPSSSEDESEVTTPLDRPMRFSKRFDHLQHAPTTAMRSQFDIHDSGDSVSFSRPPPPTSPFTGLLQTIPSEAALPIRQPHDEEEITHALSHLEGKGSPPKHDVDDKTLMRMFGHMKKAFDFRNTHNTSVFLENAAAAEKFLASQEGRNSSLLHRANHRAPSASIPEWATTEQLEQTLSPGLEPAVSKWSDTTISEKEYSEDAPRPPNLSALREPAKEPGPSSPPKHHARSHESIGYPSRVPATPETLTSLSQKSSADAPNIARRQSSPTLGPKLPPASIRTARDGLRASPAGFARTTQAAEARKTSRLPTPSVKNLRDQRGRLSIAPKPLANRESGVRQKVRQFMNTQDAADLVQTPRARSKSRYVMDKLNGLFSGKRDKKSIAVPQVTRISETVTPRSTGAALSPKLEGTRSSRTTSHIPPLPKLPTPPQLATGHPLPNVESAATLCTDEGTLVGDSAAVASWAERNASIVSLAQRLLNKAQCETNMSRKGRLLTLARALNEALIQAREAHISAETAQQAAKQAQMSNEITQKSLELLQKLAMNVGRVGAIRV